MVRSKNTHSIVTQEKKSKKKELLIKAYELRIPLKCSIYVWLLRYLKTSFTILRGPRNENFN